MREEFADRRAPPEALDGGNLGLGVLTEQTTYQGGEGIEGNEGVGGCVL